MERAIRKGCCQPISQLISYDQEHDGLHDAEAMMKELGGVVVSRDF